MKKEMVSIILPTYNRAELITDAIESVLNQSYPWFELLIIDDEIGRASCRERV